MCDSEYLKSVAEMFFLVGVATGGVISGYLSDKFGRKTMLFISVVFQTIFGTAICLIFFFFKLKMKNKCLHADHIVAIKKNSILFPFYT